ncbi:MAG: hypothetical protein ACI8WY_004097, partial [Planctomycetota bacterium]
RKSKTAAATASAPPMVAQRIRLVRAGTGVRGEDERETTGRRDGRSIAEERAVEVCSPWAPTPSDPVAVRWLAGTSRKALFSWSRNSGRAAFGAHAARRASASPASTSDPTPEAAAPRNRARRSSRNSGRAETAPSRPDGLTSTGGVRSAAGRPRATSSASSALMISSTPNSAPSPIGSGSAP